MRLTLSLLFLMGCEPAPPPPAPTPEPTERPIPASKIQSATASSSLTYKQSTFGAELAFDGDSTTAWCEGSRGLKGDSLTVEFKSPMSFSRITVEGGFFMNDKTLIKNGRIRTLKLSTPDGWEKEGTFDYIPERKHSSTRFKAKQTEMPVPPKTQSLTFTIIEADKGQTTSDVCISEIRFFEGA